jgi:hypothetical protein
MKSTLEDNTNQIPWSKELLYLPFSQQIPELQAMIIKNSRQTKLTPKLEGPSP